MLHHSEWFKIIRCFKHQLILRVFDCSSDASAFPSGTKSNPSPADSPSKTAQRTELPVSLFVTHTREAYQTKRCNTCASDIVQWLAERERWREILSDCRMLNSIQKTNSLVMQHDATCFTSFILWTIRVSFLSRSLQISMLQILVMSGAVQRKLHLGLPAWGLACMWCIFASQSKIPRNLYQLLGTRKRFCKSEVRVQVDLSKRDCFFWCCISLPKPKSRCRTGLKYTFLQTCWYVY